MMFRGTGSKREKAHSFSLHQHPQLALPNSEQPDNPKCGLQSPSSSTIGSWRGGDSLKLIGLQTILCLNLGFNTYSFCDLGQVT